MGDEEGYFHLFHYGADNSTISVNCQQPFSSFFEIINSADNELWKTTANIEWINVFCVSIGVWRGDA
jgi:hypothetical protein